MEKRQRLFIYDRREMGVLLLLALAVAVFAFTLGVHLGKRVATKLPAATEESTTAATVPDKIPNRQEIQEQSKNAQNAVDETLGQSLHDEIERTGIKLDVQRQVELPDKARTKSAGATTLENQSTGTLAHGAEEHAASANHGEVPSHSAASAKHEETPSQSAAPAAAPAGHGASHAAPAPSAHEVAADHSKNTAPATAGGKFTLQIGSYSSEDEANERVETMNAAGYKTQVRAAEVKGKGKWYRVFLGNYTTKEEAEHAGARYRSLRVIESFIVSKATE